MDVLRTPDARFEGLEGYDFEPNYVEVDGLRLHYVDVGPRDTDPVLFLHGEPTWAYLYRDMLRVVADAGFRAVAPDFAGFGRSDKPADPEAYTYQLHIDRTRAAIEKIGLGNVTLFGQDWGGLVGLRLVAEDGDRYARCVIGNSYLPTGDPPPPEIWFAFRDVVRKAPELDVGRLVDAGCVKTLSDAERAGYDAPFPDESYKIGVRRFPDLVPASTEDPESGNNEAAWKALEAWSKPFLTLFGDSDPIFARSDLVLQKRIPGASGQPHQTIAKAGHFLQEDAGEQVARAIVDWLRA